MRTETRTNNSSLMSNFNQDLDDLAKGNESKNLNDAIESWCDRLSINETFPGASSEILEYVKKWLKHNSVVNLALEIYLKLLVVTDKRYTKFGVGNLNNYLEKNAQENFLSNIEETKEQMIDRTDMKPFLLIAFVLTGVGLLLFLLNKKSKAKNDSDRNTQAIAPSLSPSARQEKSILTLLVNADRNQELINSLKNSDYLKPEDSDKLYDATQYLWIGSETKFKESLIKECFDSGYEVNNIPEFDAYLLKIELNKPDRGFERKANPMDRSDAFRELAKNSGKIVVSSRLSSKAYENAEFYSR